MYIEQKNLLTFSGGNTMKSRIHWPAIILAAVIYMILGMAWYSAWAEPWMKYTGVTEAQAEDGPAIMYLFSFIGAVIYSLTLNWILMRLGAKNFIEGAKYSMIIGLVFCFITVMNENSYQMKPVELGLINSLYPVLALTVMGGLLAAWRKAPAEPGMARAAQS